MATTPQARCASWSSHQFRVSGSPVASSLPNDVQYPSPLMFSFGIEPSITSTKGRSSSSRAAWRNGSRNSSPPRVGESTLLCRWTFGSPGIAPSRTSSIPGWPAAVIDTESPSQLIPSEIHRMCSSCTPPAGASSTAMRHPSVRRQRILELERVHEQLLPLEQLEVEARARRALQREPVQLRLCPAGPAASTRRDLLHDQLGTRDRGALRHQLEGEGEGRRHHLAQVPDLELHLHHLPARRMTVRDADDGFGDRQLVPPSSSADPGQGIPHQLIHDPAPAEGGLHQHHPGRLRPHLADLV